MSDAIDLLIGDHLDGILDPGGRERLEAWLAAAPANRRRFLAQAMAHQHLLRLVPASPPATRRTLRIRRRRVKRRWPLLAPLAAVLAAAVAGWWLWPSPEALVPGPLVAAAHAADRDGGAVLAPGDRIATGADGAATLRWPDGTRVELDAGTAVTVGGGVGLRVEHGRIAAEVAPQSPAAPAVFATPDATVTVVGTGVAVAAAAGESAVEVTHGRVRVRRSDDGAEAEVAAGSCLAVAPGLALRPRPLGAPAGTSHRIEPGSRPPDALGPGDVVEFAPGEHRLAWRCPASGTPLRPLRIRGLPGARMAPGPALGGARAALQIEGHDVIVEGLAIAAARNRENAAGIRLTGTAEAIALRGCRIEDCDQGVVADPGSGELLLDDCIVGGNGAPERPGFGRNLNLGGRRSAIRGCTIRDAAQGSNLRLAGSEALLLGSRIAAGADGEIAIEPPPGGCRVTLAGCLVLGTARADGWNHVRFISCLPASGPVRLELRGCTLVAGDPRNRLIDAPGAVVAVDGCILAGSDLAAGPGTNLAGQCDWLPAGVAAAGLVERIPGASPGFADPAAGDWSLAPDSPCRGAAAWSSRPGQRPALIPPIPPLAAVPRGADDDAGACPGR